jgi:transposase
MKPYSLDLRQKILRAYDQRFGSQRALAALFGVSQAFLEKLLHRRRTTGQIAARPHAGGRQPRCDTTALAVVRQLVLEQPDATLAELCSQLQQRQGLRVSVATMCRLLQRLDLPRKKSRFMPPSVRPRGSSTPAQPIASGSPRSLSGT